MLSLHCILFFMSLITGEILLLYVYDEAVTVNRVYWTLRLPRWFSGKSKTE